jgi:hypothetical protein
MFENDYGKYSDFMSFYGHDCEDPTDWTDRKLAVLKNRNVCFGKGGGGAAPDPNPGQIANAEAAKEVAQMQQDTAREYLDFAKTQYQDNKGFLQDIASAESAMMLANQNRADEYAQYERETFRPMEKDLISQAQGFNADAMQEKLARAGAADVATGFDNAKNQAVRGMARFGVNPNSGRFAALNQQMTTQQAGMQAGAQNQARTQAEGLGYARMQDAVNLGRGLASNASTAYGISINSGNSASANQMAPANYMGAAYGQASNQLGQASGSYGVSGNIYGQEYDTRMRGYAAQSQADAQSSAGFGNLIGTGIGVAAKLGMFGSSKDYKKNKQEIPEGKALKGIRNLDVEEWDYKDGIEDGGHHIGPYAEDFKREFGLGNGKAISGQDAVGVVMKAIQDLDAKVSNLSRNQQKPVKKANGGRVHRGKGKVRGKGGPVDDKVPAMLSNGEYVLPADTAKKIGVKNLDKLVKDTHVPASVQRKYGVGRG